MTHHETGAAVGGGGPPMSTHKLLKRRSRITIIYSLFNVDIYDDVTCYYADLIFCTRLSFFLKGKKEKRERWG